MTDGMDWTQYLNSVHFLLFLVLPLALLLILSTRRPRRLPFPLPPGPRGLPIIGNMLMMDQLTHRGLANLAKQFGGLLHLKLGYLHVFAVSSPEMAREVLQVQDHLFSNRPATVAITYLTYDRADMAFAHYGPLWRQMRKLCAIKLFSRKRAQSWQSVRDEVDAMVHAAAAAASGTVVNIGELVFNLTMNITLRAAFGSARSSAENDKFMAILLEFSKLFGAFNIGDFVPWLRWIDMQGINQRVRKARGALDCFIDKIIDEHMANPKEADAVDADMVDDMITFLGDSNKLAGGGSDDLQGSLKLTRDNIKALIMDVMFGGTETVASMIEWALAELFRSPSDLQKAQEELTAVVGLDRKVRESDLDNLPFLKCVVKETLRLHPPIPLLLHETSADCHVGGYSIPSGSRVMINVWAIGRDPAAWKDPNAFLPSRFAAGGDGAGVDFRGNFFEYIPFGSGRRSCPGMQLGLYALELAVAQLLHCFTWELPEGMKPEELDMGDVFGLTAPKAERLVAVPTPRLICHL